MKLKLKILYKKLFVTSALVLVMGSLLFAFSLKNEDIQNFKPYYLNAYLSAWRYELNQLSDRDSTASASQEVSIKNTKSVPVLLYHGIVDEQDGKNVTISEFENQMFALKNAGYQTISLEDFYLFLDGKKEVPEKSFVLTFDDGRKDSVYAASPIIKALQYEAVMFVITANSLIKNASFHLSLDQLIRMRDSGLWDVQVHTKNGHLFYPVNPDSSGHFYANQLWLADQNRLETFSEFDARIKKDLVEAKSDLSKKLGIEADSFAFPYGDYGQSSNLSLKNDLLSSVGDYFQHAFYQANPGDGYSANYFGDDSLLIKRIDIAPETSGNDLINILNNSQAKDLPYFDNFTTNNGWDKVWGGFKLENDSLVIAEDGMANGGSGFLDGAGLWQNYTFQAFADLREGDNLKLLARYQNDNNYIACDFSDFGVRLEQKVIGSSEQVLSTINKNLRISNGESSIGIKVDGNKAFCLYNNEIIGESDKIDANLSHGGIGFKSWSTNKLKPIKVLIRQVEVN
jgi:peptidoglycan/xylan/chitin deacetylase (PgdA/CDA1 family)